MSVRNRLDGTIYWDVIPILKCLSLSHPTCCLDSDEMSVCVVAVQILMALTELLQ